MLSASDKSNIVLEFTTESSLLCARGDTETVFNSRVTLLYKEIVGLCNVNISS